MLRNISLFETRLNGKQSWRLLGPDGRPVQAFDVFAKTLERRSVNTRTNYCRWLAEFFDYLFEASAWAPVGQDGNNVNQDILVEVIEAYDEYLVFGADSGNPIARRIDETLPSPRISKRSSSIKHAAIRNFLKLAAGESTKSWHVQKPEIIEKDLRRALFPTDTTEYVLARLQESEVFPMLDSPQIRARFDLLRRQLLANTGNIRAALKTECLKPTPTSCWPLPVGGWLMPEP